MRRGELASPDEFGVVLLQAAKQSGSVEKVEVVRDGRCVPCVVELAQDLAVRQLLPGIRRAEVEELAHQRGFPHSSRAMTSFEDAWALYATHRLIMSLSQADCSRL